MSARVLSSLFGASCLVLLAAALWLPVDLGRAAPAPTEPASDLAALPGDCGMFLTFRPATLLGDPLGKAFAGPMLRLESIEAEIGVPVADLERVTFALVGTGDVTVYRTRKPFDKKKVTSKV